MNKTLLITRPKHDGTVRYLYFWAEKILKAAREKNINILDLKDKRANREETESMLRKKEPSLVFFNGHGNDDCITGHDNEPLISSGKNDRLLNSKIIYALSCRSGNKLGPESVKNGALGYIGYDDFIFIIDESKMSEPLQDKTAELFLEPSNQIMTSLLKENTLENSHKKSKGAFRISASKVSNSEAYDNYLIPYLLWDMQHQVCLGDKECRLK